MNSRDDFSSFFCSRAYLLHTIYYIIIFSSHHSQHRAASGIPSSVRAAVGGCSTFQQQQYSRAAQLSSNEVLPLFLLCSAALCTGTVITYLGTYLPSGKVKWACWYPSWSNTRIGDWRGFDVIPRCVINLE